MIKIGMREFSTQALVLDKEDLGEADARIFLYSPEYGKIIAKVKSAKKPLSKLSAHIEPFNFISARIIDRGPQIVDALILEKLKPSWALHKLLNFIKETTPEGQSDYHFWHIIKQSLLSGKVSYWQLLAVQGFDPQFAICENCCNHNPSYFYYKDQSFWCQKCISANNFQFSMINFQSMN